MSRALVIGASGQLGRALCAELRRRHEVMEAVHRAPQAGQHQVDLAEPEQLQALLARARAEWILVAAAIGNVDRAETEPALCRAVNVEAPRLIAAYAQATDARAVHYSSDAVFDGSQAVYTEDDAVCPVNAYGRNKVDAEAAMRELLPGRHLVIRTAWLYGPDEIRRNFVVRVVDDVRAQRRSPVPSDQWGTPTFTADVAAATRFLLEQGASGTFHAAGPEFMDRASFAMEICRRFGLSEGLVVSVPSHTLGQAAKRPLRVRLDSAKLRTLGGPAFRTAAEGLALVRAWDESLQHA